MEKLYYIIDTESNNIVIDNLFYEDAISWLIDNGDPVKHILLENI
jgi:hypothetical protein